MLPADQVVAFSQLAKSGATVAAIAARFGVTERLVEQRLRLGNAAPELLDADREDAIDLETLKAFSVIARSNGETVQVHGAEAARRFRLSTQVPTAPVFHTSASSRTIRIGNITVRMVHTSNRRRLRFAGEAPGAALSALWYLGKDNVPPETVAAIEAALGPAEFRRLRSADMPAWMTKAIAATDGDRVHDLRRLPSPLFDLDIGAGPQRDPLQAGWSPRLDDVELAPGGMDPHAEAGQVAVPEHGVLLFHLRARPQFAWSV